jgi:hypothetical protein
VDVFEAAYRVAHDFKPDGAVGLARKLGKNPGTFLNQLNPNTETHNLPLATAVQMSVFTGDPRIVNAFALELGRATVALPDYSAHSSRDLVSLLLQRDRAIGEFAKTMEAAIADGRLTPREIQDMKEDGMAVVAIFLELISRVEKGLSDVG